MATEQFSLCWDNFHKNMSSGMQSMLENEDLVDVTLAVEGRHLKAHKMVLSVCSPYFRELFKSNPCKHPIVFMKDVSYLALRDLLQFMYQGEVQVAQEHLTTFIKTAEALQIKGLTGDGNGQSESEVLDIPEVSKSIESVKQSHDVLSPKPSVTRIRKPGGPASKRPRFTLPPSESASGVHSTTTSIAKPDPAPTNSVVPSELKTEPNDSIDQSQIDDLDRYDDEPTLEDDTEDYTLMEAGDEEPKAGTSTEGISEGQDDDNLQDGEKGRRKKLRMRYIYNGFVYHTSVVRSNPPIRYLICAKYGSTGCHARAILPINASIEKLRVTRLHNHPPDETAEEKFLFFKQLKEVTKTQTNTPLKMLFDAVLSLFPRLASEMSFGSIRTSMRRWRKEVLDEADIVTIVKQDVKD